MRAHMRPIHAPEGALDIVGTGGDNHGTLNVSTAAAFVVAACGVPVAKHGNRAATSLSGSSDTLRKLGVNLEAAEDVIEKGLNDLGIAFLFAPRHHPAMSHVAEVRRKMGVRTIFNLLGPLTNPANVRFHLIGAYEHARLRPMAEVLKTLGSTTAWLAYGHDGLDEITTTNATSIVELREGALRGLTLTPEDFDLPRTTLETLKGGDAALNAKAMRDLFNGTRGAYHDIVVMNAAAALIVAGRTEDPRKAATLAAASVASGAAREKLDALIELTTAS